MCKLRWISIVLGVCLSLVLAGSFVLAAKEELTPYEYSQLSRNDKLKYKTVYLKTMYRFRPELEQKTLDKFDEIVASSEKRKLALYWYNAALFMEKHPEVRLISGKSSNDPKELMSYLAAGTASWIIDIHGGGGPKAWKKLGVIADITDLVKNWDQTPYVKEKAWSAWKASWIDGRCYGVLGGLAPYVFVFRKDWYKEAGIFNKKGEPAPPENWTWQDLREIAIKLTDIKKKRWGYAYSPYYWEPVSNDPHFIAASFGVLTPWNFVIPDKSGKYTWRFGVTPQLVKVFQFLHDLKFRDKCMLSDPTATGHHQAYRKEFIGGRAGMCYIYGDGALNKANSPSPWYPNRVLKDDMGVTTFPMGKKTGIRANVIGGCTYGFLSTLSKKELEIAFDWWDWNVCGRGKTLFMMETLDNYKLYGKRAIDTGAVLGLYHPREIPLGFPDVKDIWPEEYLRAWNLAIATPSAPEPAEFGLRINKTGTMEAFPYLQALFQTIVSKEDLDVEVELKKIAEKINREAYNYKIEGDKEKLKKFVAATEEFYKENYPSFYNSNMFKETIEKYWKVW